MFSNVSKLASALLILGLALSTAEAAVPRQVLAQIQQNLKAQDIVISRDRLKNSLALMEQMKDARQISRTDILTLVDLDRSPREPRIVVINLYDGEVKALRGGALLEGPYKVTRIQMNAKGLGVYLKGLSATNATKTERGLQVRATRRFIPMGSLLLAYTNSFDTRMAHD